MFTTQSQLRHFDFNLAAYQCGDPRGSSGYGDLPLWKLRCHCYFRGQAASYQGVGRHPPYDWMYRTARDRRNPSIVGDLLFLRQAVHHAPLRAFVHYGEVLYRSMLVLFHGPPDFPRLTYLWFGQSPVR